MRLRGDERVLVRVPSWLGDTVMAEPALRALSEWQAERADGGVLSLAGPGVLLGLLAKGLPNARLLPLEREGWPGWRDHDVALLFTGSFRSAWMALRAGIPERVGWSRDGRGLLLTTSATSPRERGGTPVGLGQHGRSRRWLPRPFGTSCNELLALIGVPVRATRPRLAASAEAREVVAARLAEAGIASEQPVLAINAGGRSDSAKSVPNELWVEAVRRIRSEVELAVVIVTGPGEESRAEACGSSIPGAAVLTGPTLDLDQELALFERAAVVLTGDVGPRHLAVACGAKLVTLFGPTDPRHTADFLEQTRLLRRVVPCGPCHQELCPLDGPKRQECLRETDPAAIAAATLSLL